MIDMHETIGLLLRQARVNRDKIQAQLAELTTQEIAYDNLVATLEAAQQDAAEIGD